MMDKVPRSNHPVNGGETHVRKLSMVPDGAS